MRICLDTNIWISSLITRGSCHELIRHCLEHHQPIISDFIIGEITDHLPNKFKFPSDKVNKILKFIKKNTQKVVAPPLEKRICRDQEDDAILSLVAAGEAVCLITGDKDLLVLKSFHEIPILSPKEFWQWERKLNVVTEN